MAITKIDEHFSQSPQIRPDEIRQIAEAGYKTIVCARPDDENPGQPSFAEIAEVAARFGLKAVHIPVSGPLTEGQIIQFAEVKAEAEGPILGYCRAGGRAGALYNATL